MASFLRPGQQAPSAFGLSFDDRDAAGAAPPVYNKNERLAISEQRRRLPIYAHRTELLYLVETHATTVVVGETGSGKTTQIPQYLHEAGGCWLTWTGRGVGLGQSRAYTRSWSTRLACSSAHIKAVAAVAPHLARGHRRRLLPPLLPHIPPAIKRPPAVSPHSHGIIVIVLLSPWRCPCRLDAGRQARRLHPAAPRGCHDSGLPRGGGNGVPPGPGSRLQHPLRGRVHAGGWVGTHRGGVVAG